MKHGISRHEVRNYIAIFGGFVPLELFERVL
jgi:hypothetical protein